MRNGSVVRKRRLGNVLRDLRLRAGMTIEAAAPKLDFSAAKLSRIETAQQGVDVHVVRTMMDIYGVYGDRWEELLELTREAAVKGWWRAYGLDDQGYLPLEADASTVREYSVMVVPGLLQTPEYARAVFRTATRPRSKAALDRDVTIRMIRQQRLTAAENPLEFLAVIDEGVLRRPLGGRAVMRAQLAHLVEVAALDTVTVQVLPSTVVNHPGYDGPFIVLSFDDLGEPDMGYAENPLGAMHTQQKQHVARGRLVFDRLRALALSPAESTACIEQVVAQL